MITYPFSNSHCPPLYHQYQMNGSESTVQWNHAATVVGNKYERYI